MGTCTSIDSVVEGFHTREKVNKLGGDYFDHMYKFFHSKNLGLNFSRVLYMGALMNCKKGSFL